MRSKNTLQKTLEKIVKQKQIKHLIYHCNRIHFIVGFFILCFIVLLWKTFSYTVLNVSFYKDLADNQQIGKVVVPVTRGTIYSSTDKGTILGTSLNLYNLSIDPKAPGSKEKLSTFLVDISYKQICENKKADVCHNNLSKFLKVLELEDFDEAPEYVKKKIEERINKKIYQDKVTSVLIDRELDAQRITNIAALGIVGIYPRGSYIYANPEEISGVKSVAAALEKPMGLKKSELEHLLRKRDLRYVPILKKTNINVYEYLKEILDDERQSVKKGVLDSKDTIYPFIILETQASRFYPENTVASQVIGFVDNSGAGNYGIEGKFNSILKGTNGQILSRKDIKGRTIDPIELNKEDFNVRGASIKLTIDRNIQSKVEQILESGVKKYRANKGSVVIMNPQNGDIIALANYPTYDVNNYGNVYDLEKVKYSRYPDPKVDLLGFPIFLEDKQNGKKFYYDNKEIFLRKADREELGDIALVKYKYVNGFGAEVYKNDAISSLYEPGSIMKAVTVAVGIDSGEITQNSTYLDKGSVKIDEFEIKNVSDKCLGYHTFGHALNFSCNVGMIRIVQRVGKQLLYNYFKDFGFNDITGIDLYGEVFAQMESWENWSTAKLLTNSYGLGISVTPLQMATAYSIVANGGTYITPKIIDEVHFASGKDIVFKTEKQRRVIKKSTSDQVSQMLVSSLKDGAAKNGYVPGYSLAGKTGTSQIAYKGKYETGIGSTNASFAGFGPIEDPKFTIVIKLERPRANIYGGQTSAFLFKDISEYLLDYYGIPKKSVQ